MEIFFQITYDNITKIDRIANNLTPILEAITETSHVKNYHFKGDDPADENNTDCIKAEELNNEKVNENSIDCTEADMLENDFNTTSVHQTVFVDIKKELIKEESTCKQKETKEQTVKQDTIQYHRITKRRTRFLDANNWKKYKLSKEEAVREFKAKCEDLKYLKANFKCTDCYKGFSKEKMLNRHIQLRHSEVISYASLLEKILCNLIILLTL